MNIISTNFIAKAMITLLAVFMSMTAIVAVQSAVAPIPAHAQTQPLCEGAGNVWENGECVDPDGGICLFGTGPGCDADSNLWQNIVNALLFLVGAVSVIMLIVGGLRYVASAGDANAVTAAKNTIIYAIVGIVIAIAGLSIATFVINSLTGS